MSSSRDLLTVAIGQNAPIWLNRDATLDKVATTVREAASQGARLIAFSEAHVPGYPFWSERTDGARFESDVQKDFFAHYVDHAVDLDGTHLDPVRAAAREGRLWVYLGIIERTAQRGHSVYATLVAIDDTGEIRSAHRKLRPTYDERLNWSPGDGHGLRVHDLSPFRVGGLNCWENWMPLPRAALYAQGEDLHVASWPGGVHNTQDITRFIAREGRSYVLSASAIMRKSDITDDVPHADLLREASEDLMANGGSCIAGPDGEWVVEPVANDEQLIIAEIDHSKVRRERQNFDPAGHYSRPDVVSIDVNRTRQVTARFTD